MNLQDLMKNVMSSINSKITTKQQVTVYQIRESFNKLDGSQANYKIFVHLVTLMLQQQQLFFGSTQDQIWKSVDETNLKPCFLLAYCISEQGTDIDFLEKFVYILFFNNKFRQFLKLLQEKHLYDPKAYLISDEFYDMLECTEIKDQSLIVQVNQVLPDYDEFFKAMNSFDKMASTYFNKITSILGAQLCSNSNLLKQLMNQLQQKMSEFIEIDPKNSFNFPWAISQQQADAVGKQLSETIQLFEQRYYFGETQFQANVIRFISLHQELLQFVLGVICCFYKVQINLQLFNCDCQGAAQLFFYFENNKSCVKINNNHQFCSGAFESCIKFFQNNDASIWLLCVQNILIGYKQQQLKIQRTTNLLEDMIIILVAVLEQELQEMSKQDDVQCKQIIDIEIQQCCDLIQRQKLSTMKLCQKLPIAKRIFEKIQINFLLYKINVSTIEKEIQQESIIFYTQLIKQTAQCQIKLQNLQPLSNSLYNEIQKNSAQIIEDFEINLFNLSSTTSWNCQLLKQLFEKKVFSFEEFVQLQDLVLKIIMGPNQQQCELLENFINIETEDSFPFKDVSQQLQYLIIKQKLGKFIEFLNQHVSKIIVNNDLPGDIYWLLQQSVNANYSIQESKIQSCIQIWDKFFQIMQTKNNQLQIIQQIQILFQTESKFPISRILDNLHQLCAKSNPELKLIFDICDEEYELHQSHETYCQNLIIKLINTQLLQSFATIILMDENNNTLNQMFESTALIRNQHFMKHLSQYLTAFDKVFEDIRLTNTNIQQNDLDLLMKVYNKQSSTQKEDINDAFQILNKLFEETISISLSKFMEILQQLIKQDQLDVRCQVASLKISVQLIKQCITKMQNLISFNPYPITEQLQMQCLFQDQQLFYLFICCSCGIITYQKERLTNLPKINQDFGRQIVKLMSTNEVILAESEIIQTCKCMLQFQECFDSIFTILLSNNNSIVQQYLRCIIRIQLNRIQNKVASQLAVHIIFEILIQIVIASEMQQNRNIGQDSKLFKVKNDKIQKILAAKSSNKIVVIKQNPIEYCYEILAQALLQNCFDEIITLNEVSVLSAQQKTFLVQYCKELQNLINSDKDIRIALDQVQYNRIFASDFLTIQILEDFKQLNELSLLIQSITSKLVQSDLQSMKQIIQNKYNFEICKNQDIFNYRIEKDTTYQNIQTINTLITSTVESKQINNQQLEQVVCTLKAIELHNCIYKDFTFVIQQLQINSQSLQCIIKNIQQFQSIDDKIIAFNRMLFIFNVFHEFVKVIVDNIEKLREFYEPDAEILQLDIKLAEHSSFNKLKRSSSFVKIHSTLQYTIEYPENYSESCKNELQIQDEKQNSLIMSQQNIFISSEQVPIQHELQKAISNPEKDIQVQISLSNVNIQKAPQIEQIIQENNITQSNLQAYTLQQDVSLNPQDNLNHLETTLINDHQITVENQAVKQIQHDAKSQQQHPDIDSESDQQDQVQNDASLWQIQKSDTATQSQDSYKLPHYCKNQSRFSNNHITKFDTDVNCTSSSASTIQNVKQHHFILADELKAACVVLEIQTNNQLLNLHKVNETKCKIHDIFPEQFACKIQPKESEKLLIHSNLSTILTVKSNICAQCKKQYKQTQTENQDSENVNKIEIDFTIDQQLNICHNCAHGIYRIFAYTFEDLYQQISFTSSGIDNYLYILREPLSLLQDFSNIYHFKHIKSLREFIVQFQDILLSCVALKRMILQSEYIDQEDIINKNQLTQYIIQQIYCDYTANDLIFMQPIDVQLNPLYKKIWPTPFIVQNEQQEQLQNILQQGTIQMQTDYNYKFDHKNQQKMKNKSCFYEMKLLYSAKFILMHVNQCEFCQMQLQQCTNCNKQIKYIPNIMGIYKQLGKVKRIRRCEKCQ